MTAKRRQAPMPPPPRTQRELYRPALPVRAVIGHYDNPLYDDILQRCNCHNLVWGISDLFLISTTNIRCPITREASKR